jgi:hypothetical protein
MRWMRASGRTITVTYWPNLDAPNETQIKLGVFGDLRMGDRYALGLIARTQTKAAEAARAGRLTRRFVENPYKALREMYEDIWNAPSPADAFERVLSRSQSSLVFSDIEEAIDAQSAKPFKDDVEDARTWCMDKLRPILRQRFHSWIENDEHPFVQNREQLDQVELGDVKDEKRVAG